jgi:hypothetical protein
VHFEASAEALTARSSLHPVQFGYVGLYVASVLAAATIPSVVWFGALLVASWTVAILGRVLFMGPVSEADAVFLLWLAAGQNVLLGAFVEYLSPEHVRLLIGTNFLLGTMWVAALGVQRMQAMFRRSTIWILLVLPAASLLVVGSAVVFGFNGTAALASARNIMTPVLFFVLGWLIGWRRSGIGTRKRFMRAVVGLGLGVILLGLVERFATPDVWSTLHVGELWTKKGLTNVADSGIPRNWWSAEQIGGAPVRRLVSTFADPINLGTFLFLVTVCGYGLRMPFVVLSGVAGILLTVSKGGLLGCLVFTVVFAYYRSSKVGFLAAGVGTVALGLGFIAYSAQYATRSLFVHMGGAAYAILGLPQYPLGRGIGRAGTMAQQFSDLGDQQILESGLGIIAGQLGVPGVLLYLAFLGTIYAYLISSTGLRERIVAVTLFWSITLNITFNEVALSPNSSAGYFVLLGLIVGGTQAARSRRRLVDALVHAPSLE